MNHDLAPIVEQFAIEGRFLDACPYGTGHINDTYLGRFETASGIALYVHQRINRNVFRRPEQLMENIARVTGHLRDKVCDEGGDPDREALTLVRTTDGGTFLRTASGDCWRTYLHIGGARTYDGPEEPDQVREAGRAFGRFQRRMADLPGPRLHETIPAFHDTARRFEQFLAALEADSHGRAAGTRRETDFVLARRDDAGALTRLLESGALPERITHNDTKLNNVMLDDRTGRAVCVIDLDTVMPGLAVYDFGDAVRIAASTAPEDERDLARVRFDVEAFDRLACGYLGPAGRFLTPAEVEQLVFAARLMTFECGMRFLADHLAGDVYFKIHRPAHNLDRCRTQFKMIAEMERRAGEMQQIVLRWARRAG